MLFHPENFTATSPKTGVLDPWEIAKRGYCVGCGICASSMKETEQGTYVPAEISRSLCPFSGEMNEDVIAKAKFESLGLRQQINIGYYHSVYAGHVQEGDFRKRASSGGFTKWLLIELLKRDLVDRVVQVYATPQPSKLYQYEITDKPERVLQGSGSAYYPVHLSDVLKEMEAGPSLRYAVVGLPCFVKGLTELTLREPKWKERVHFTLGLLCGHLKTKKYAEALAWQLGAVPGDATKVDFRGKYSTEKNPYHFRTQVRGKETDEVSDSSKRLAASDRWDLGAFKLPACDVCDDVAAETADVVIGDAWFGKYLRDVKGNNVILTRNKVIHQIIEEGIQDQRLNLSEIDIQKFVSVQRSNINHRQVELKTRLKWHPLSPPRRANKFLGSKSPRFLLQATRHYITTRVPVWYGHARAKGDISDFIRKIYLAKLLLISVTHRGWGWMAALTGLICKGWCRPLERLLPNLFFPYARLKAKRVFVHPPSFQPGNLGDQALLGALFQDFAAQGMKAALWVPNPKYEAKDFGVSDGDIVRFPFLLSWRFDEYCFVATDTLDGTYDGGKRLWMVRFFSYFLPCTILNASLKANIPQKIQRNLEAISRKNVRILFRDSLSFQRGESFFPETSRLTSDLAFHFTPDTIPLPEPIRHFIDQGRAQGKQVAAICPSTEPHIGYQERDFQQFLDFLKTRNTCFVIVRHDSRFKTDKDACLIAINRLGSQGILWELDSASQARALTKEIDYSCSWRMHLGIASLASGKPAALFEYNDKGSGIWESLGVKDLVTRDPKMLPGIIQRIEQEKSFFIETIGQRLGAVQAQSLEQVKYLRDSRL